MIWIPLCLTILLGLVCLLGLLVIDDRLSQIEEKLADFFNEKH